MLFMFACYIIFLVFNIRMLCLFGCYIIFTCFSKEIRKHREAIIFAHYIMFECYIRSLNTIAMYRRTKIYISIR